MLISSSSWHRPVNLSKRFRHSGHTRGIEKSNSFGQDTGRDTCLAIVISTADEEDKFGLLLLPGFFSRKLYLFYSLAATMYYSMGSTQNKCIQ